MTNKEFRDEIIDLVFNQNYGYFKCCVTLTALNDLYRSYNDDCSEIDSIFDEHIELAEMNLQDAHVSITRRIRNKSVVHEEECRYLLDELELCVGDNTGKKHLECIKRTFIENFNEFINTILNENN